VDITVNAATDPPGVSLEEPWEFGRFAVRLHSAPTRAELDAAVEGLGTMADDEHVFVDIVVLKALAGPLVRDPGWTAKLDGMVAFASSKGWLDEHGRIRAHLERGADER
jgi:hypothetical protein